jgi:flavin-dependent dehydrogenase
LKTVGIVGGGLAGLLSAIQLARSGVNVTLFEKNRYPFHRVCGEYVSNETKPFLQSLNLYPEDLGPVEITEFQLTSVNGKSTYLPLDLGGFGISRYSFDSWLASISKKEGVKLLEGQVDKIHFAKEQFHVHALDREFTFDVVVGAFGKRSRLDRQLNRGFMKKSSPYVGVKYHIRTNHPQQLIALHNFRDGYCGISNIEEGKTNLCYLTHRNNLRAAGNIKNMEETILFQNPFLKSIFQNAEFLFDQPEVINEISFAGKAPVENHIFMTGDSAGMISPLCGNGMAMAIHSSKLLHQCLLDFCKGNSSRAAAEHLYAQAWKRHFSHRLWAGRKIQGLFGSVRPSNMAVWLAENVRPVAHFLMRKTHGTTF